MRGAVSNSLSGWRSSQRLTGSSHDTQAHHVFKERPDGRARKAKPAGGRGQRKPGESARSFHQSRTIFTPATTTTEESLEPEATPAPALSGGSWWGGLLSTATAAVSQAQAAVKDLQKN